MNYKLRQGEDQVIEIVVIDDDNNKVDLTQASKIRVGLYIKNLLVFQYEPAWTGSTYGEVEVDQLIPYQLNLLLTRSQSRTFPIGDITAVVLLEFPDALLTTKTVEYTYLVGTMEKGFLKNEILN